MKVAVKIPLAVSEQEASVLDSQSRITNWLYNQLLETANALRQQYRATEDQQQREKLGLTLYTERGLRNLIPGLKVQHPFLKVVYSSVLKNAALRLSKAIRDYQDGQHDGGQTASTGRTFAPGNASGFLSSTTNAGRATPWPDAG